MELESIKLIDLHSQRERLGIRIDRAMTRVLAHGQYILGPEVHDLEQRLAEFAGVREAVTCSSGTDALLMALLDAGIGPGHTVFVPAFTFISTAGAVLLAGATPVLVDIEPDSYLIAPQSLQQAIAAVRDTDLRPGAVIPVDLYGQPADYEAIDAIARQHELFLLCDAGQSFGAARSGRCVGTFGHATAVSFYPSKPLGCYGDGGAVLTDDPELAARLRDLRVHGCPRLEGDCLRAGLSGRMDTLQAAILIEKLSLFSQELEERQRCAQRYHEALGDWVQVPRTPPEVTSTWAAYTIGHTHRDHLVQELSARAIETRIYYPKAIHHYAAYRERAFIGVDLSVSDAACQRVLSLPIHPYLSEEQQERVIEAVCDACRSRGRTL